MRKNGVIILLLLAAVGIFAVRNLPWHLDNYDQARQAYAAIDVVENGHWLFQTLPFGGYATKPPLLAWMQAAGYYLTGGSWPLAWRLPGFAAALVLLGFMCREGDKLWGRLGASLAVAAFAFNILSIRIATLVRTDMLLALLCFLPGLMIWQHVQTERAWSRRERILMGVLLLAGIFTKGHAVYAFILPGLVAYAVLMRMRKQKNFAWTGWVVLLVPLLVLVLAVVWTALTDREFYEEIVLGEVLLVFGAGGEEIRSQPFIYYTLHLIQKWVPWSLLLLLLVFRDVRALKARWREKSFVWLVCWSLGGLVVMSMIPQKRVDRIYPVIPPLTMLLVYLAAHYERRTLLKLEFRRLIYGVIVFGACLWTVYGISEVVQNCHKRTDRMAVFSRQLQAELGGNSIEVVSPAPEGFMCYFEKAHFLSVTNALDSWLSGTVQGMIVNRDFVLQNESHLQPFVVVDEVCDPFYDDAYVCIMRTEKHNQ